MSFMCVQCPAELETLPELQAHIKDTHISKRNQDLKLDPVKLEEIEQAKTPGEVVAPIAPIIQPPPPTPPEPIILEYRYKGQCPDCRSQIKTIQIPLGDHYMMTAYCVACDKTQCQILTIPIDKQSEYTESVRTNDRRAKNAR